jgi:hypothetical protein
MSIDLFMFMYDAYNQQLTIEFNKTIRKKFLFRPPIRAHCGRLRECGITARAMAGRWLPCANLFFS